MFCSVFIKKVVSEHNYSQLLQGRKIDLNQCRGLHSLNVLIFVNSLVVCLLLDFAKEIFLTT